MLKYQRIDCRTCAIFPKSFGELYEIGSKYVKSTFDTQQYPASWMFDQLYCKVISKLAICPWIPHPSFIGVSAWWCQGQSPAGKFELGGIPPAPRVSHRSRSPLRLTATAFWMSVRRIRALARAKLGELSRWSHWNPEKDLLQDVGRRRSFALDAGSTVSGSEGACVYHRILCYGIYVMLAVDRGETLWFGCCQIYSKSLGMNYHDLSWTSA